MPAEFTLFDKLLVLPFSFMLVETICYDIVKDEQSRKVVCRWFMRMYGVFTLYALVHSLVRHPARMDVAFVVSYFFLSMNALNSNSTHTEAMILFTSPALVVFFVEAVCRIGVPFEIKACTLYPFMIVAGITLYGFILDKFTMPIFERVRRREERMAYAAPVPTSMAYAAPVPTRTRRVAAPVREESPPKAE